MTTNDIAVTFLAVLNGERERLQETLRREAGTKDLTIRDVSELTHKTRHYLAPFGMDHLVDTWIEQVLEPNGARWSLR